MVARYRKLYPFLPYEQGVTAGSDFVVFDVPDVGRFGMSICYDMWFAGDHAHPGLDGRGGDPSSRHDQHHRPRG